MYQKLTFLVGPARDPVGLGLTLPIIGYMGQTIGNPTFDWMLTTVPQKFANNRVVNQPRGKGLGGSSLVSLICRRLSSLLSYVRR